MDRRLFLWALWTAVVSLGVQRVAAQEPSLPALGNAVESFLVEWMRGNPAVAAQNFMSAMTAQQPQILPFGTRRDAPAPEAQDAQRRLATELEAIRADLWPDRRAETILQPTRSIEAIEGIASVIEDLGLEVRPLDRPPVLAFRVRTWADIAWCGSVGPRHRGSFDTNTLADMRLYGVIGQLRSARNVSSPVLMLWRFEPSSVGTSWKVVTLFPIVTK
jgi:hypothetical protein